MVSSVPGARFRVGLLALHRPAFRAALILARACSPGLEKVRRDAFKYLFVPLGQQSGRIIGATNDSSP
jgi:hypothetical protein